MTHISDERTLDEETDDESSNIVNIHDPFFLWGLDAHSDRALIRRFGTLTDVDRSRLYWTCHYHKREAVCKRLLDDYSSVCIAHDAIKKISEMSKTTDKEPDLTSVPVPFILPTSPTFTVVELKDGSFIPSKGKPLKFTVVGKDGNTKMCIYKHGDELLQDAMCVAVMKEMQHIFEEEKCEAEIVIYEVLPVDKTEGLIECVANAHPFLEFQTAKNDTSKATDDLKEFIEKSPERKENLFRTFIGFVVSGIVLRLNDRHDDNILVTDEGKILHIDFGCAFGQKTKLELLLGLFMDVPNSPFSEDVFIAIIGRDDDEAQTKKLWKSLKDRTWTCFDALRRHKNRFKPIHDKDQHFHENLLIALNDDDARAQLEEELEKCYNNRFNAARSFYYKLQQNIVS